MKKVRITVFIIFVSIMYSCHPDYSILKDNSANQSDKPNDEIARVVFLRPATGSLGKSTAAIYDQDQLIGILPGSSYFIYDSKPGQHIFGSLYGMQFDFVKGDLEVGKTYYVLFLTYDTFIRGIHGKILAIKKDSEHIQKLKSWLSSPKLKQAELTNAGRNQFMVLEDNEGKYVSVKPGWRRTFRIGIEALRNEWIKSAETSGKETLTSEDGQE